MINFTLLGQACNILTEVIVAMVSKIFYLIQKTEPYSTGNTNYFVMVLVVVKKNVDSQTFLTFECYSALYL